MVQSFYRRLRMPPAPLTTPANQFANPGGFARTSAFRPSTLLPVDQAGNKQMSLLQKGMDMAKGPQGQSLLGALATPFATSALAGALGNTMNPNLRGLAGALKGVADMDTAQATIAGRSGDPSAVREFKFYQSLSPDKQTEYMKLKRKGYKLTENYNEETGRLETIMLGPNNERVVVATRMEPTEQANIVGAKKGAELSVKETTELRADKPTIKSALKDFSREVYSIQRTIDDAIVLVNNHPDAVSLLGTITRAIPGTKGNELSIMLKKIFANVAFGRLQNMRANSPTGGALGNVSNIELDLLKSSAAAISQTTKPEFFIEQLVRLHQFYTENVNSRHRKFKEIYDRIDPNQDNTVGGPGILTLTQTSYVGPDNTSKKESKSENENETGEGSYVEYEPGKFKWVPKNE